MVRSNLLTGLMRSIFLYVAFSAALFLSACQGVPSVTPRLIVVPSGSPPEKWLIFEEPYEQNNCGGTAEASAQFEHEHAVTYVARIGQNLEVSVDGMVGVPGVGQVGAGAALSSHYDVSYGKTETLRHQIELKAAAGTRVEHVLHHTELWEMGTLVITAGQISYQIPYRFPRGYRIELVDTVRLVCSGVPTPTPTPVASTEQPPAAPQVQLPSVPPVQPTATPTLVPAEPRVFNSQDRIPPAGSSTLSIQVYQGELHVVTSGPVCVPEVGVCLPGGANEEKRGSVLVLTPRTEPYILSGLIALNNWHGSYFGQPQQATFMADKMSRELRYKSAANANCEGGCDIVDVLILGTNGVIASYTDR